jgi:hypothetical protein
MAFFDWGLLALTSLAAVASFAVYRSQSVIGSPVADHVRAIKAVAWTVCTLFLGISIFQYGDAPIGGVGLVVLWLLAFSDIVAALARIGARLQVEIDEANRPPPTVAYPPHR